MVLLKVSPPIHEHYLITFEVFVPNPLAFQPIQARFYVVVVLVFCCVFFVWLVFFSHKLLESAIVYFYLCVYAVPKTIGLFLIRHHHNHKNTNNLLSPAL